MALNNIAQTLMYGKPEEIRHLLQADVNILKEITSSNKKDVFNNILASKAFDLIDVLIAHKIIETDIYEYDSFNNSVFTSIVFKLPIDEESIAFLERFIGRLKNINDEVADQTLIGFLFEEGADLAVIKCFADAGCNLHYKNNCEATFIYQVTQNSRIKTEKTLSYLHYLIEQGVEIDAKNIAGNTPLLLALERHKEDLIPFLLEAGANCNEQNNNGWTAFYIATVHLMDLELYQKLLQFSAPDFSLTTKNKEYLIIEYIRMISGSTKELQLLKALIKDGADVNQSASYYDAEKSVLDWAAEKNENILSTIMTTASIDVNAQDNTGNTLLHKTCAYNINFDKEAAKSVYRKVKMLIEAGADVNMTNDKDETPLMLASQDNLKVKTVELLMEHKG